MVSKSTDVVENATDTEAAEAEAKKQFVSVSMSPEMKTFVDAKADELDMSVARLVRHALAEFTGFDLASEEAAEEAAAEARRKEREEIKATTEAVAKVIRANPGASVEDLVALIKAAQSS